MACVKWFSYRGRNLIVLIFVCWSLLLFVLLFQLLKSEIDFPVYYFGLKKKVVKLDYGSFGQLFNSTCSHAADRRGPHQKVISYSLYGDFSRVEVAQKYLFPLINTISLIPYIYPGWIVRIYHNFTDEKDLTILLARHVDLCNATMIMQKLKLGNLFAMTWRWIPLLDETVDVLLSRDSDSKIVPREEEAVREWLESKKIFHVMRDHPAHCIFGFIMGCCWGVKISLFRSRIIEVAERMLTISHFQEYDYDQILLDQFIWPIAKDNAMVHDSYCCEILQPSQPFPIQRKDRYFVGARAIPNTTLTEVLSDMDECPPECRPPNYIISEWDFC